MRQIDAVGAKLGETTFFELLGGELLRTGLYVSFYEAADRVKSSRVNVDVMSVCSSMF